MDATTTTTDTGASATAPAGEQATPTDAEPNRTVDPRLGLRIVQASIDAGPGWCGSADPHPWHSYAVGDRFGRLDCRGVGEVPETELRAIFGDR
jgi:hypothetical protein